MNGSGWSESELAVLEDHAWQHNWLAEVAPKLPHRSIPALRSRMAILRAELCDRGMSWFHNDARRGSEKLLAALEESGLRAA